MHKPDRASGLGDDQCADVIFIDGVECCRRQHVLVNRLGLACHDVVNRQSRKVSAQIARYIAVCDDACQITTTVDNHNTTKTLLRQNLHRVRQRGAHFHQREALAAMHDIADMDKTCPQRTTGMKCLEVTRGEAARFQKCYCQRITDGKLHHG